MKKRFLSLLLAVVMVVSLVPVTTLSATAEGEPDYTAGNIGGSLDLSKADTVGWTYSSNSTKLYNFNNNGYAEWTVYAATEGVYTFEVICGANAVRELPITVTSSTGETTGASVQTPKNNFDQANAGTFSVVLFAGNNTLRISPKGATELYAVNEVANPGNTVMYTIEQIFHTRGESDSSIISKGVGIVGETITATYSSFPSFIPKSESNQELTLNGDATLNNIVLDYYNKNDISSVISIGNTSTLKLNEAVLGAPCKLSSRIWNTGKNTTATWNVFVDVKNNTPCSIVVTYGSPYLNNYFDITFTNVDDPTLQYSNTINLPKTKSYDDLSKACATVTVPAGYYSVELKWWNPTDLYGMSIFGGVLASYNVNHYLDGSLYKTEYAYEMPGKMTGANVLDELLESCQPVAFSQYVLTDGANPDININYYRNGFLSFDVSSSKINVTNQSGALYLLLPHNQGLNNVTVTSVADGTLTVDGTDYNLTANIPVTSVDISSATSITFTSSDLGFDVDSITVMKSENIDSLYFTLDKALHTITKADSTMATGSIAIIGVDGTVTELDSDSDSSTPEVTEFLKRGSSSYSGARGKYPFKFKLAKKTALVKDNNGKDVKGKSWVLIANNTQEFTGFGNTAGFDMYQALDGDGAVSYKFVNLYVDGNYRGVYILAEKSTAEAKDNVTLPDDAVLTTDDTVAVDSSNATWASATTANGATYWYCSNAASSSFTGFIVEQAADGAEKPYIMTATGKVYNIKEPNYPTQAQLESLATYLQDFENALFAANGYNSLGKYYAEYVDLDSMAKAFIVKMFMNDFDWFANSTYLAIDCNADGSFKPMISGNVWDTSRTVYSSTPIFNYSSWTNQGIYSVKFLQHGDFLAKIYELIPDFADILSAESAKLATLRTNLLAAEAMNDILHKRNFVGTSTTFINGYNGRITTWNNAWSDVTKLRGVTVAINNGTLTATAIGTATFQWYQLNGDGHTGVLISDATDATYTPAEGGTYYVVATGSPLSGTGFSSSIVSNPVSTVATFDSKLSGDNVVTSLSLLDNTNINFKVVNNAGNDVSKYTDWTLVVKNGETEVARVTDWYLNTKGDRIWCQLEVVAANINTVYSIHYEAKNEYGEDVYGETFEYGVVTYCDAVLANSEAPQTLKDLCTSIKNLGDTAAAYQAYLDSLN